MLNRRRNAIKLSRHHADRIGFEAGYADRPRDSCPYRRADLVRFWQAGHQRGSASKRKVLRTKAILIAMDL